ncbi:hypothetical protein ACN677_14615 [Lactiplantibacillus paraplantarum]|uniref:hypothetical protein n=1 Tax=Lactiplantibacillus paraplantarum TaxID=60520 RepID=UPI000AD205BD|nr:hypothetical protein [Lactiplantibacillus paraplantarum]
MSQFLEVSASGIVTANRAQVGLVENPTLNNMTIPTNLRADKIIHDYQYLNALKHPLN